MGANEDNSRAISGQLRCAKLNLSSGSCVYYSGTSRLEFSLSEIAYILDCPVGIRSRLHYACQALRKRLQEIRRLTGEVVYGTS